MGREAHEQSQEALEARAVFHVPAHELREGGLREQARQREDEEHEAIGAGVVADLRGGPQESQDDDVELEQHLGQERDAEERRALGDHGAQPLDRGRDRPQPVDADENPRREQVPGDDADGGGHRHPEHVACEEDEREPKAGRRHLRHDLDRSDRSHALERLQHVHEADGLCQHHGQQHDEQPRRLGRQREHERCGPEDGDSERAEHDLPDGGKRRHTGG